MGDEVMVGSSMTAGRRRKPPMIPLTGPIRNVWDMALIVTGAFVMALAFNLFLLPNHIASGGVAGISIIAAQVLGIEPAYTQWVLNIPLFIAGYLLLGRQSSIRSLLGTIVLPLFIYITRDIPAPTTNPLLGALYGGIGVGLGLGIVFRGRGSTGGLAILAQIIHKLTGFSMSVCVSLTDGTVILLAGILLKPEQALYALIGLFVTSKMIDAVELGFSNSKVAYIISEEIEPMRQAILNDMDRGLTKLNAEGGYTGDERTVFMVVVGQNEASRLKTIVRSVDPEAFVVISNAHEVLGKGFKLPG
ncbi:YitT family protein [Paenibacillus hunanensis]